MPFRSPLGGSSDLSAGLLTQNEEERSSVRPIWNGTPALEAHAQDDSSIPGVCPAPPESRNVKLILWYTVSVFAGRSIWNQNVLANFAFLLRGGDPKAVGFLTAAMGIAQLLSSFPAGYLADKYRRDTILKLASGIGVLAIGSSLLALWQVSFYGLLISLSIWGAYWGCAQTSLTALFADSVPDGQRSQYFTTRSILIKVGQLAGPVLALAMFYFLGNEWSIHECLIVMVVGQLICFPAIFLLCYLNDDLVPRDSEDLSLDEPLLCDESGVDEGDMSENTERDDQSTPTVHQDEIYDGEKLGTYFPFISSERIIPTFVAIADVMSGLASGMSIRYFPIFLVDNLHVNPVMVQVLYIIAPFVQMGLMKLIQRMAKRLGRCTMAFVFKWIGVSLFFTMVISYERHWPVWVTCTILIFRTTFMNAPSALTRAVLMDHVRKEERAKWSALESLNMFSWSGSAFLGGFLVDKEGIVVNFIATACLQFLASIPLVILSCFRKKTTSVNTTSP